MPRWKTAVVGAGLVGALALAGCSSQEDASRGSAQEDTQADATSGVQVAVQPDDQGSAILNAITGAKVSVDIPIYDIGGDQIEGALKTAKQNGVNIRIMANGGYGSYAPGIEKLLADLTAAPGTGTVQVNWSNNNFSITHQKSVIVDAVDASGQSLPEDQLPSTAKVVISTGNFAEYQGTPFYAARDYDMTTSDPATVKAVEDVFQSDFSCAPRDEVNPQGLAASDELVWSNGTTGANKGDTADEYPTLKEGYPSPFSLASQAQNRGNSSAAYARVIDAAQKGDILRFSNEELKDETIVDKLSDAAKRGADVRINMSLPPKYDPTNPSGSASALWGVWEVVRAGGTAHMFTNNSQDSDALYIHAKIVALNDSELFVGSENASTTSLEFNRELGMNLGADDQSAIDAIVGTFDRDWANGASWVTVWTPANVPTDKPSKKLIEQSIAEPVLPFGQTELLAGYSDTSQKCGAVQAAS